MSSNARQEATTASITEAGIKGATISLGAHYTTIASPLQALKGIFRGLHKNRI